MKIRTNNPRRERGSTLLVTLVISSIMCFSVVGYLAVIEQQAKLGSRSQTWNMALGVAEAGIEEGLQHLNANSSDLSRDGWTRSGAVYWRSNVLANGSAYLVRITNATQPEVTCQAYVTAPAALAKLQAGPIFASGGVNAPAVVTRKLRVRCARGSLLLAAMVAKHTIDLNGNGIMTDSFDSGDPAYSTNGQYDPAKSKDNGDVASNDGIVSAVDAGNANIHGKAKTGPGGTVRLGPQGSIGSKAWQATRTGVEPGWVTADANFTFPDTELPSTTSALAPTDGYVVEVTTQVIQNLNHTYTTNVVYSTNYYNQIISSGTYVANSLPGNTLVTGSATLVLPTGWCVPSGGAFKLAKAGSILLPNGTLNSADASVSVFCGGTSIDLAGNSVINQPGCAGNFILYGGPTVTSFSLSGNAGFTGVLVAPNVNLAMNGGGNDIIDFVGAVMVNSVVMNGHYSFHYDEALGRMPANGRFLITSWDEVAPD